MSIRVIVIDIDGTLTNSKKEITSKTRDALINAQEMGIKVILASGRPTKGMIDFAKILQMDKYNGLLVCFNGSRVVDCKTKEVLFNEPMSKEESKQVLRHIKKFNVRPIIDKDDYMYVNDVYDCFINNKGNTINILEYESRSNKYKLCEIDDLVEFVDFPINKILTYGDSDYLKDNYIAMMEPFTDTLSCMFTGPVYFEFTAKGIDKAKALESVLKPMGYTRDNIIAFGDGHNDISMIEYAGIGVAMENAVSELKAISNEITLSNEKDGIVYSLYKHIPNLSR